MKYKINMKKRNEINMKKKKKVLAYKNKSSQQLTIKGTNVTKTRSLFSRLIPLLYFN